MAYRYFSNQPLPQEFSEGRVVTLDGEEAHHLLHVMRARQGAPVILFDGRGAEWETTIQSTGKKELTLQLLRCSVISRESSCYLALAVALPKGERQKWMVEKLVELGTAEWIPLETERSVAKIGDSVTRRLERCVIEASKQCGRNTLMKIADAEKTPTFWDSAVPHRFSRKIIAHPEGKRLAEIDVADSLLAAIGPEGGFSDAEVEAAQTHGWIPVSLGERILRTETAAITLAAITCTLFPSHTTAK
ncbi:MAG: RsmE family RNA methyltransferase [Planctomycetia bacterium]|nr:RsmE family RNA methyltransferase [Planctomycetia bacterium]